MITPIVLAAGASSRMGSPKAAVRIGGQSALAHVLEACAEHALGPAIVVAGAHPDEVRDALAGRAGSVVLNPDWARGRATSIRAGLAALPAGVDFLLWPVDCPLAGPALGPLLAARGKRAARGWVPSFDGRRGHPILFERSVERELRLLGDDEPARNVVRALAERGELEHVVVDEPAVLLDANTPAELAALELRLRSRG